MCNHVSHDPAAPVYAWIPPDNIIVIRTKSDDKSDYYLVILEDKIEAFEIFSEPFYYDAVITNIPIQEAVNIDFLTKMLQQQGG